MMSQYVTETNSNEFFSRFIETLDCAMQDKAQKKSKSKQPKLPANMI